MSKQKWRRRKVPRWLVRCAPHQALGSLLPPDLCFGVGCPPEGLISRRLSSPCYGGPRVRIRLPPAGSLVRTCLSREFAFLGREATVFRGVQAGTSGAVGRDTQGAATSG